MCSLSLILKMKFSFRNAVVTLKEMVMQASSFLE